MTPARHRVRVILAMSAVSFIALAVSALVLPPPAVEVALRQLLLRLDTGIGADVLRAIDQAGTWRVILPGSLLVFALFRPARPRWWIWVVAFLAAPAAETFFKFVIGRTRPEDLTMGFPSGHATAAAAFFGSVIYLAAPLPGAARHAVQILAVACIVLVATGRVALGAHWPTDSLAGIALGISLASAAYLLAAGPRWTGDGPRRASPGPSRPPS